jgi:hypothetical protein
MIRSRMMEGRTVDARGFRLRGRGGQRARKPAERGGGRGVGAAHCVRGAGGPLWGGLTYWLVGPALYVNGVLAGRARKRLQLRLAAG